MWGSHLRKGNFRDVLWCLKRNDKAVMTAMGNMNQNNAGSHKVSTDVRSTRKSSGWHVSESQFSEQYNERNNLKRLGWLERRSNSLSLRVMDNSFSSVTFHFSKKSFIRTGKNELRSFCRYNQIHFHENGDVFGYLVLFCVSRDLD